MNANPHQSYPGVAERLRPSVVRGGHLADLAGMLPGNADIRDALPVGPAAAAPRDPLHASGSKPDSSTTPERSERRRAWSAGEEGTGSEEGRSSCSLDLKDGLLKQDGKPGKKATWTPEQKRIFRDAKRGIQARRGNRVIFLTLTTSDEEERSLQQRLNGMKAAMKRWNPLRLWCEGYITSRQLSFYREWGLCTALGLGQYLRVDTQEGNGVIHAVITVPFLPQAWLNKMWHSWAWVVQSKPVYRPNGLASYLVQQYVAGQEIVRITRSKGWIPPYLRQNFGILIRLLGWDLALGCFPYLLAGATLRDIIRGAGPPALRDTLDCQEDLFTCARRPLCRSPWEVTPTTRPPTWLRERLVHYDYCHMGSLNVSAHSSL